MAYGHYINLNGRKRQRRDPVSKLCSQTYISIALKTKEENIQNEAR